MFIDRAEVHESGGLAQALTDLTNIAKSLSRNSIVYVEMRGFYGDLVDTATLYDSALTDGSIVYKIVLESLRKADL